MIKEAYCSYEISKLLKEKGFDEPCLQIWECESDKKYLFRLQSSCYQNITEKDSCLAPTHQMAMAWLMERNIGIVPEIHTTIDPKDYYWGACIFYLDKSWDILQYVTEPSKNIVDGYDGVIEQALKYVLENLI
jgi:hypothetical protein